MTDEEKRGFLEKRIPAYSLILVDTSSLMSQGIADFWQHALPVFQQDTQKIIVPRVVVTELENNMNNSSKAPEAQQAARQAYADVCRFQKSGDIKVVGDANDAAFADNVILAAVTRFRLKYDILVITQDHDLAKSVLTAGKSSDAVRVKRKVHALAITRDGWLRRVFLENDGVGGRKGNRTSGPGAGFHLPGTGQPFADVHRLQSYSGSLPLAHPPVVGEAVFSIDAHGGRTMLHLTEEMAHGGEGAVFRTDRPGLVAKIYFPKKLTRMKFEKLKRMVAHEIDCPGICFPKALIFNMADEFCGCLMDEARGDTLWLVLHRLLKPDPPGRLGGWQRKDTVQLCITILEKISFLHSRNILIGDINYRNILVVSPTEIYFVDADSYQIEGFPCPVGLTPFTAPEIQGKNYETFLRTVGHENFAIATLLFMIMMPAQTPYAALGMESLMENIHRGDFPYPLGAESTGKAPIARWRYCWSHLPYKVMKEAFYQTFRKGGAHSMEATRFSADAWLQKFIEYRRLLTDGTLAQNDPESLKILPTRYKKYAGGSYGTCSVCHREVETSFLSHGVCVDCHNKIYKQAVCVDCGQPFDITYGDKAYFEEKGLLLPKRCHVCRERRKQEEPHHLHFTIQQQIANQLSRMLS